MMTDTAHNDSSPAPRFSQSNKQAFRNPWVLAWIGGIILVFGVNIAFIITAFVTNPGLVEKDYYEKGRSQEAHFMADKKRRAELGWQMKLEAVNLPVTGQPVRYTFSIVDTKGIPIDGDKATLYAYRPSDANADFSTDMQKIAPGVYSAELIYSLKGAWVITAVLQKGKDSLEVKKRISVATTAP